MRGGKREGAGRPKGTVKNFKRVNFNRSVNPEWVNILDNIIKTLRKNENDKKMD